jgi:hypothetical protein
MTVEHYVYLLNNWDLSIKFNHRNVLRLGKVLEGEVVEADRDGATVIGALYRWRPFQRASILDDAVLADEKMVANSSPAAVLDMLFALGCNIVVMGMVACAAMQKDAVDRSVGFGEHVSSLSRHRAYPQRLRCTAHD